MSPVAPAIAIPNSIYIVGTTIPDAPVLVFHTPHFGTMVTKFEFYGGRDITVASTTHFVNLAMQQLIQVCD
jgi:hypothetical protein